MNIKNGIKLKVTICILADFIALREATTISAPTDMPDHSREYFALRTKKKTKHENEGLLEARVSPLPDKGHLFLLTTQTHKGKEKERKNKMPLTEC